MGDQMFSAIAGWNVAIDYMVKNTSITNPLTIQRAYEKLQSNPSVKNKQQVSDAIKHAHKKGILRRAVSLVHEPGKRGGRAYEYWFDTPEFDAPKEVQKPTRVIEEKKIPGEKPEIVVTESKVVINTSKVKITVEF